MKTKLTILFSVVLLLMLIVTSWASMHESVLVGGEKLFAEPWGVATLADTYFGFLTFYVWVAYKETTLVSRIGWFIGIMLLGNIAMAIYMLIQIKNSNGDMDSILLRKPRMKAT